MKQVGRIQDSASTGRNLLITQACDLVTEFAVTASCIYYMCVAVTETRHDESASGINELLSRGGQISHRTEISNDPVFNDQIRIVDTLDMPHGLTSQHPDISGQNSDQFPDIMNYLLFHLISIE